MQTSLILVLGSSLVMFTCNNLPAQNGPVSAGGEAFGTGGLLDYSIGQIDYTFQSGTEGYLNEGLQQPYDILEITGLGEAKTDLGIYLYPNPASDFASLRMETKALKGAGYVLEDLQGKLIFLEKINEELVLIPLKELTIGVYLLKIISEGALIKTFKIIKNQ